MKPKRTTAVWMVAGAVALLCMGSSLATAQERSRGGGAGPADPPTWYRSEGGEIDGPSVVEGKKSGIEDGQYAPDFELEPVEAYASLTKWLGDDGPASIERNVKLSELVGKAPIMLFCGSFT